jgi:hypothetical protein
MVNTAIFWNLLGDAEKTTKTSECLSLDIKVFH